MVEQEFFSLRLYGLAAEGRKEGRGGAPTWSRRDRWQALSVIRLAGNVGKHAGDILGLHRGHLGVNFHRSLPTKRIINRGLARQVMRELAAAFYERPYKPRFDKQRASAGPKVIEKAARKAARKAAAKAALLMHGLALIQPLVAPSASTYGSFASSSGVLSMYNTGHPPQGGAEEQPGMEIDEDTVSPGQGRRYGVWPAGGQAGNIPVGGGTGWRYVAAGETGRATEGSTSAVSRDAFTAVTISSTAAAVGGPQSIDDSLSPLEQHTSATSSMSADEFARYTVVPFRDVGGHAAGALVEAGVIDRTTGVYAVLKKLGEGAFGLVYDARKVHSVGPVEPPNGQRCRARLWNQPLALKAIPLKELDPITNKPENHNWVLREVDAMQKLQGHQNIVQLIDTFVLKPAEGGGWPTHVCLVMERAHMTLSTVAYGYQLTEAHLRSYIYQTALALHHIHSLGFSHLDIKLENLLLTGNTVKVTDFGVCSHPSHNIEPLGRGTFDCGAPEFHLDLPMGQPADLWSFGITVYELITRSVPFSAQDDDTWGMVKMQAACAGLPANQHVWPEGMAKLRAFHGFRVGDFHFADDQSWLHTVLSRYWASRAPGLIELFSKTWAFAPSQRGTFQEILGLPWLQQLDPLTHQYRLAPETWNPSILPPLARRADVPAEVQQESEVSPFCRPASPAAMLLDQDSEAAGQATSSDPAVNAGKPAVNAGEATPLVLSEALAAPALPVTPTPLHTHAADKGEGSVAPPWAPAAPLLQPPASSSKRGASAVPSTTTRGQTAVPEGDKGDTKDPEGDKGDTKDPDVGGGVSAPTGEELGILRVEATPPRHIAISSQAEGSLPNRHGALAPTHADGGPASAAPLQRRGAERSADYESSKDYAQPEGGSVPKHGLRSATTSPLNGDNFQASAENSGAEGGTAVVKPLLPHFESGPDDWATGAPHPHQALPTGGLHPPSECHATSTAEVEGAAAPSKAESEQREVPLQEARTEVTPRLRTPARGSGETVANESEPNANFKRARTSPAKNASRAESDEGATPSHVALSHGEQASNAEASVSSPELNNATLNHAALGAANEYGSQTDKIARPACRPVLGKRTEAAAESETALRASDAAVESGTTGEGSEVPSPCAGVKNEPDGQSGKKRRRAQDDSGELGLGAKNKQGAAKLNTPLEGGRGVKRLSDSHSSAVAIASSAGDGGTTETVEQTGACKRKRHLASTSTSTLPPLPAPTPTELAMHEASTSVNSANGMPTADSDSVPPPSDDTTPVREKTEQEDDTPSQPHKKAKPAEPLDGAAAAAAFNAVLYDGFGDDL